ncbi:MAG: S-layer homology domain-containing protein [Firmicutes bacterium]|nr:S-layer homology domain-containing protein [Bacillota bacterium]
MKRVISVFIILTILFSAVNIVIASGEPGIVISFSDKTAYITIENVPADTNSVQMELFTNDISTGYELFADNGGSYALLKEKKLGNAMMLTIYSDNVKIDNAAINLGKIECPKTNCLSSKANLILLDRELNPIEYKDLEVNFGGKKKITETSTEKTSTAETQSEKATDPVMHNIYYTITAEAGAGGSISPSGKTNVVAGNSKEYTIIPYNGYKISNVTVNGNSVGAVDKYRFENVNDNADISVSFEAVEKEKPNENVMEGNYVSFPDLTDHWAKEPVGYLAEKNIVKGAENGMFLPENNITRAEFVTMLAKISGDDISGYTNSPFGDVDYDDWFMPYVEWARTNGIVAGIRDGVFAPKEKITREQMAFIIVKFADAKGYTLTPKNDEITFADEEDIRSYSLNSVKRAQTAGIINGSNGKFYPESYATRAEASQMLYSLIQTAK